MLYSATCMTVFIAYFALWKNDGKYNLNNMQK